MPQKCILVLWLPQSLVKVMSRLPDKRELFVPDMFPCLAFLLNAAWNKYFFSAAFCGPEEASKPLCWIAFSYRPSCPVSLCCTFLPWERRAKQPIRSLWERGLTSAGLQSCWGCCFSMFQHKPECLINLWCLCLSANMRVGSKVLHTSNISTNVSVLGILPVCCTAKHESICRMPRV